ncbi:MAG: TlpA family protein disulfide reductase [Muribaculaceae bacterium]|nr:TlpA family protein disulfide reductase [Muribaculaceae bacterium]
MKTLTTLLAVAALSVTVNARNTVVNFSGPIVHDKIFLYDYDSGVLLDSAVVTDNTAIFDNSRIAPGVVGLKGDKGMSTAFILDDSDITVSVVSEEITGGIRHNFSSKGGLNDSIVAIGNRLGELHKTLGTGDLFLSACKVEIYNTLRNNIDNPLAYYLLLSDLTQMLDSSMIDYLFELNPKLKSYNKIQEAFAKLKGVNSTQPGNKFADFEVSYKGVTHRLGDVVGKGDYVLLDFWASWCMPCRHEMPYIKRAYDKFAGKNLKIISVAVSDDPEDSLKAAAKMDMPWNVWVNGGKEIMTTYGFDGIPLLILFGPDGTILERGGALRGENITEILAKYIK